MIFSLCNFGMFLFLATFWGAGKVDDLTFFWNHLRCWPWLFQELTAFICFPYLNTHETVFETASILKTLYFSHLSFFPIAWHPCLIELRNPKKAFWGQNNSEVKVNFFMASKTSPKNATCSMKTFGKKNDSSCMNSSSITEFGGKCSAFERNGCTLRGSCERSTWHLIAQRPSKRFLKCWMSPDYMLKTVTQEFKLSRVHHLWFLRLHWSYIICHHDMLQKPTMYYQLVVLGLWKNLQKLILHNSEEVDF